MEISKLVCIGGLALTLAACGGEKKEEPAAAAVPAKLAGGLYEALERDIYVEVDTPAVEESSSA